MLLILRPGNILYPEEFNRKYIKIRKIFKTNLRQFLMKQSKKFVTIIHYCQANETRHTYEWIKVDVQVVIEPSIDTA